MNVKMSKGVDKGGGNWMKREWVLSRVVQKWLRRWWRKGRMEEVMRRWRG